MKILICCAETKKYIFETSFIQAFKDIGHDVVTCGAVIGDYAEPDKLILKDSSKDIKVWDKKEHPETYTYAEILALYKAHHNCNPDLILQYDPHFYLTGEKPKDIVSAYYIVDAHRGADVFRRMALQGSFDYIFIAQKYFMPLFRRVGLNCFWLPCGYDDNFIKEYPEIEQQCDIVFAGETGLSKELNNYTTYDSELEVHYHANEYLNIPHERRYRSWNNHSMEYAERAEILIRLSRDFDLRVYEDSQNSRGENYAKILCRGKIVVNHSLWFDSAYRNLEVLGCKRFLVADMLPYQEELLKAGYHYYSYRHYFLPFLSNFDLEYEEIKGRIDWVLRTKEHINFIIENGYNHVKKYHTFKERAKLVTDIVFNGRKEGYIEPTKDIT